jgi:hypothetical protein
MTHRSNAGTESQVESQVMKQVDTALKGPYTLSATIFSQVIHHKLHWHLEVAMFEWQGGQLISEDDLNRTSKTQTQNASVAFF